MRYDFAYIEALHAKARRQRSEAIYALLIAPLVGLFTHTKPQKRAHHAPRPHLAGQG
jgi:hypothetical protein